MESLKDRVKQKSIDLEKIKDLALSYIESDWPGASLEKSLRVWFCRKYNLPLKTKELDHYTLDELLLEYEIVTLCDDTEERRKVRLELTGDPDTDELWYQKVAPDSKTPDEIDEEYEIGEA